MEKEKKMKKGIILLFAAAFILAGCNNSGKKAEEDPAEAPADSVQTISKKTASDPKEEKEVSAEEKAAAQEEEPLFDILTTMGTIRVKLYSKTPKHRDNFIHLAITGYYDGVLFHRVVPDFVIQAGDPNTRDSSLIDQWGQGGPDYMIPPEFVPEYTHKKGALAAARSGDIANPMKESHGSQFYIVVSPENCQHLDGEYTVFGEVVSGLNTVDRISRVRTDKYDRPLKPIKIRDIKPSKVRSKRTRSIKKEESE